MVGDKKRKNLSQPPILGHGGRRPMRWPRAIKAKAPSVRH
jgi:hypothetical protein